MRTTDERGRDAGEAGDGSFAAPVRSRAWRALLVLIAFVAADLLADFVLGSYATLSAVSWDDYRSAQRLDCLFVGSSYAQRSFDPLAFDEVLGTCSVNLATPGQMLADSCDAARLAIGQKGVRRVVLGMGIESLTTMEDPYARVPYLRARHAGDVLGQATSLAALAVEPEVIGTKSSLNVLAPWVFTPVRSVQGIADNVRARLMGEALGSAAERVVPGWHYVGQGYGNYDRVLCEGDADTTASVYGLPRVRRDCLDQVECLCELCADAGVELVIVSTPHPAFDILSLGRVYPEAMREVELLASAHGATFLDFNLARDGLLDLSTSDFGDFEHLGIDGARKLSRVLADVCRRIDAGEDVSGDFFAYDEWDAWVDAHA